MTTQNARFDSADYLDNGEGLPSGSVGTNFRGLA
jgi:hypothetical protein